MPVVLESGHAICQAWSAQLIDKAGLSLLGKKVADVGCGPGLSSLCLSDAVGPSGSVLAVEASEANCDSLAKSVSRTHISNVKVICSGLDDMWEINDKSVDFVFSRWAFSRVVSPAKVISEIHRILKPGGKVVIIDWFDSNQWSVCPPGKVWDRTKRVIVDGWTGEGYGPDVGKVLPSVLQPLFSIDFLDLKSDIYRPGNMHWHVPTEFFKVHLSVLAEQGVLSQTETLEFHAYWKAISNDTAAYYTPPSMIGIIGTAKSLKN